ncbi:MAG: ACT domain-containing protein, partial [Kiritimatiellae bacterium]|nr:ACT domain-containing protein [Kiritimatiellia bacterium]
SITRASGGAPAGERYVASVMGPDRPGRIHEIARIFADAGVNVEDWRHDFSDPERTLTVGIVTVPASCDVAALQKKLADTLGPTGLATSLRHENIFRATNEVGPIRNLLDPSLPDFGRNAGGAAHA